MLGHVDTHGFEFDIPHAREQIAHAVNQSGFISPLPQRIRVLIGEIEVLHAITPQHLHRFTQRCLGLGRD